MQLQFTCLCLFFCSALYYTQSPSNESVVSLIKYRYNVEEVEVIMGLVDSSSRDCICSQMTLFPIFTVDPRPNEVNNVSIYVVDAAKWDIWGLDKDGCHCYLIHNSSLVAESSLGNRHILYNLFCNNSFVINIAFINNVFSCLQHPFFTSLITIA